MTDSYKIANTEAWEYWAYIQRTLDNPADIWAHVFDAQLNDASRVLVVFVALNGRPASEESLRASFRRMAARAQSEHGVIRQKDFDSSIRLTNESLLKRTIDAKTGIAFYELYNPAIGDFVLKKYTSSASSLHSIFAALESTASLDTLRSMKEAGILTTNEYRNVLKTLVSEKLAEEQSCVSPDYQMSLAELAVTEPQLDADSVAIVSTFITRIDFSTHELSAVEEGACVLMWSVDAGVLKGDDSNLANFARNALAQDIAHDEYVALSRLIGLIRGDEAIQLKQQLKSCIEDLWRYSIDQYVTEEGVLDDYYDLDDTDRASEAVEQYVADALGQYEIEFEPSEVCDIASGCDLTELISENRDRAAHEDHAYEVWRDEEPFTTSEVDPIDDLFDRR